MESRALLRPRRVTVLAAVLGSMLVLACSSILGGCPGSKGPDGCVVGTAGCGCTQAGACDPGLSCRSGLCAGSDVAPPPGETARPTGTLALQPFRGAGFTFAAPRGFVGKAGGPGTYVFEPGAGSPDGLSRFQISYLGRMGNSQAPSAVDLLEKALKDRGLKQIGKTQNGVDFVAATADTGVPGPGRFVRLMYLNHWDLRNEDVYMATAINLRRRPEQVDMFTAEFAMSDASAVERYNLAFVLRSIGWGISIPADDLSRQDVVGTWEVLLGGLPLQYEDERGNWIGGQNEGSAFKLTFDGAGNYQLSSLFSVQCTGGTGCAVEGVVKANSRGRFELDGGVLVLDRDECELRTYDKSLRLTNQGGCPYDLVPVTLRAGRGEDGHVRFSGLGSDVINAKDQRIWLGRRTPAGSWNVTDADRAATPAPPSGGGVAICGPVDEKEPNFESPSPFAAFGRELAACLPTYWDYDFHEITTPRDSPGGGWVELTVLNATHGIELGIKMPGGRMLHSRDQSPPGVAKVLRWAAAPDQKFILSASQGKVPEGGAGWSRYTMTATYNEVKDVYEPNETAEQATPIKLGVPVQGFFFGRYAEPEIISDSDWFVFDLQVGAVSIKIDEIASDIHAYAYLADPEGRQPPDTDGLRIRGLSSSVHTPALNGSARIDKPGPHRLEVKFFKNVQDPNVVPESWQKPYRLLVTQP